MPLWVEETLRYDTLGRILARAVEGELTLYDTTLPDGDLLLLPGSARRDERAFESPDDFIIGREIGAELQSSVAVPASVSVPTWPGWKPGRTDRIVQANPDTKSTRPTPSASTR